MQVVDLIIAKESNIVLTRWCSPTAAKYLCAHGVAIVTGMIGTTVAEVLQRFERADVNRRIEKPEDLTLTARKIDPIAVAQRSGGHSNRSETCYLS